MSGCLNCVTEPARFRDVFAVAEFRALWAAQVLSLIGDQLARVALGVLVFDRTGSPLWAAATYAISFLPWVAGGPVLSVLADRLPRRRVMVVCDLARAALVAMMVVPGISVWLLAGLLFVTELFAPPFDAARSATLPLVLEGDRYVAGTAIGTVTFQVGQLVGFVIGGATVAAVGVRTALAIDAATFVASAMLLVLWVRHRPAPGAHSVEGVWAALVGGARLVFSDPYLRAVLGLAWLAAFYAVPQGLAVPYAAALGGDAVTVGLLLAAYPLGISIAAVVFSRLVRPELRLGLMGPLAIVACGILILCASGPGLVVSLLIFAISGAASCYQLAASVAYFTSVPDAMRGRAFGLAQAGLSVGQGAAILLAGAAAERWPPATVIAASGLIGAVTALPLVVAWHRVSRRGCRDVGWGRLRAGG